MVWFKVDDSFYDHPKVFELPDAAVALWTRAGCWSARNLTDGFVPAKLPARLCDDPDTGIRALVDHGLWKRTRGGYQFHDWSEYQPTADAVKDLRAKRAEAGRRGGLAKAAHAAVTSDDKQNASKRLANASHVGKQNSTPTRPDPTRTKGGEVAQGGSGPSPEPPPRCPQHIDDENPPPCGACADARRTHERWEADQAQALRRAEQARRSADARRRAQANADAIAACRMCDQRGYLPTGRQCSHDPGRVSGRGAAVARAVLDQIRAAQPTTEETP